MASVVHDPGGRKRISFRASPPGQPPRRRTLRLGKVSEKAAQEVADAIECLIQGRLTPAMIGAVVLEWVGGLDDKDYGVLVHAGLVPARDPPPDATPAMTLKAFLEQVTAALHVKPATRLFYGHTRRCLLEHFGEMRDLASIDARAADGFAAWLTAHNFQSDGQKPPRILAAATVSRRLLLARHTFNRGVRWGLMKENPFAGVKVGQQINVGRQCYVPRQSVEKLLEDATDPQFALILALSRWAGLRCPSEHLALRWQDVDFERGRILVHAAKTEHHAGGGLRSIPLFPEIAPLLQRVFDLAEPGESWVITRWRSPDKNLRTRLLKAIVRVGLTPWPKLFHNLRASCETDLVRLYPIQTVARWLGHNPAIMVKHYLTEPDLDADFQRAAGRIPADAKSELTRDPTRPLAETQAMLGKPEPSDMRKTPLKASAGGFAGESDWALQDSNCHPQSSANPPLGKPDAPSDAPPPKDPAEPPQLAHIITKICTQWASLTPSERDALAAYVLALKGGQP